MLQKRGHNRRSLVDKELVERRMIFKPETEIRVFLFPLVEIISLPYGVCPAHVAQQSQRIPGQCPRLGMVRSLVDEPRCEPGLRYPRGHRRGYHGGGLASGTVVPEVARG